jgi:hypothetical protein
MNTKHAAEYQKWDVLEYFISKGGSYIEGFENVLKWVGHTQKIEPVTKKLEVLDRLQKYINDGLVKVGENGYKVGSNRNSTLKDVLDKYGSVRNWVVASHPDLEKTDNR